jgi:hypothetical protein
MPTPVVYPSAKHFVGLAVETTQGTAVTPITYTQPCDKADFEDKPNWLEDKGMRGSMTDFAGRTQGVISSEFSIDGAVYFDGIGYFLRNMMGDITESGATPVSHAFGLLNSGTGQPNSLTLVNYSGPEATSHARVYAGACLSELVLKGNAATSLIMWSCKGFAFPSAVAGSAPVAVASAEVPMAGWRTKLGLGGPASGGTLVSTVEDWELTIKRELKPKFVLGQQAPWIIFRNKLTASLKLTLSVPSDESNSMTYLLNNTQPQLQLASDNGLTLINNRNLTIDALNAAYTTSKPNYGSETVGYDVTIDLIANTTNAGASGGISPTLITLKNAVAAAVY